jgi:drug/metabolite transporter (DMT)-like permease
MAEIAALVIVQVLFGINYVISKQVIQSFDPLVWAGSRAAIATVLLFVFAQWARPERPKLDREFLLPILGFAFLGVVINQTCFLLGLKYTTATNSAVINTMIPIATLFFGVLLGRENATRWKVGGIAVALTGVLILKKIETFEFQGSTVLGDTLTLINCLSYALFLVLSRNFLKKYDAVWTTAWMFLVGSIVINLIAVPQWLVQEMPEWNAELVWRAAFAIIGGTFLTYLLNTWALARVSPSRVAVFIYLQPIVAAVFAFVALDEMPSFRTAIAGGLIFCGLLLTLKRNPVHSL